MELIPAIDLKEGRVVRLLQGDFAAQTRYACSPQAVYGRYADAGARRLHIVDLDAARGAGDNTTVWTALVADGRLKVQLGGGLRSDTTLQRAFDAGLERAVLGSIAVTDPAKVAQWLHAFGGARLILALDVRLDDTGTPRLATHGWEQQSATSLWDAVAHYERFGLQCVLCTDVSRDGAMTGPNLALYAEAIRRHPHVEWQASGGIRGLADLTALRTLGLCAAICGRALLEGQLSLDALQSC